MPREIDRQAAAQKRSSRLLLRTAASIPIPLPASTGLASPPRRPTRATPHPRGASLPPPRAASPPA